MKRILFFIAFIITFSIITEEYIHCNMNHSVNIVNSPNNSANNHSEENQEYNEFIVLINNNHDLIVIGNIENIIYQYNFPTQNNTSSIWQPPKKVFYTC